MNAAGNGAAGSSSAGSATTGALGSAALLAATALVAGLAASLAKRLNAGTRRTASAAAERMFPLNLIVVSSIARRDSPVDPIAGHSKRKSYFQNTVLQEKKARTAPCERSRQTYGAGTLMTVFTIVTDAPRARALPFNVVTVDEVDCPGLEIVRPAWEMIVPTIVPPPP